MLSRTQKRRAQRRNRRGQILEVMTEQVREARELFPQPKKRFPDWACKVKTLESEDFKAWKAKQARRRIVAPRPAAERNTP